MQAQVEKTHGPPHVATEEDCLCPPVCFQCPPPFCLPCGPGPGGVAPDNAADLLPAPRQCGPFMMLNTPMERKMIMLPMMDHNNNHHSNHHHHNSKYHDNDRPEGRRGGHRNNHHNHHRDDPECCDKSHHHHHGGEDDLECCEKSHHHHHHDGDDQKCKLIKHGKRDRDHSNDSEKRGRSDKRDKKKRHGSRSPSSENERHDKNKDFGGSGGSGGVPAKKRGVTRTLSRELRSGKLYIGCDCEKRNGLQDECQRSLCRGSPECVTNPPTCAPSEYSAGKHLAKRRADAEKKIRDKFKKCF